jgi:hypothetical protein
LTIDPALEHKSSIQPYFRCPKGNEFVKQRRTAWRDAFAARALLPRGRPVSTVYSVSTSNAHVPRPLGSTGVKRFNTLRKNWH